MTDILLRHTDDGGEITVEGGRVALDDTLETATYLSLFGGNEQDSGAAHTDDRQWWGNLLETDPTLRLRSETQHLLRALPAREENIPAVEDAMSRDLAWMSEILGASVEVTAAIPARNRLRIDVVILLDGERSEFDFDESWETS